MHENGVQADLVAHNQVLRILFWKFWWSEPIYPNLVWRNLDRSRSQLSNDTKIIKFGQILTPQNQNSYNYRKFSVDSRLCQLHRNSHDGRKEPVQCRDFVANPLEEFLWRMQTGKVLPRIWGLQICWLIARFWSWELNHAECLSIWTSKFCEAWTLRRDNFSYSSLVNSYSRGSWGSSSSAQNFLNIGEAREFRGQKRKHKLGSAFSDFRESMNGSDRGIF